MERSRKCPGHPRTMCFDKRPLHISKPLHNDTQSWRGNSPRTSLTTKVVAPDTRSLTTKEQPREPVFSLVLPRANMTTHGLGAQQVVLSIGASILAIPLSRLKGWPPGRKNMPGQAPQITGIRHIAGAYGQRFLRSGESSKRHSTVQSRTHG